MLSPSKTAAAKYQKFWRIWNKRKMIGKLAVLSLCVPACTTAEMACEWYPSADYQDVGKQCSGMAVAEVPRMLPSGLQLLLLTNTAVSSLDSSSFRGRVLPKVTTLKVTGGALTSVGAHAFCALPALTLLGLSRNQLKLLDSLSVSCNKFLRTVVLVDNPNLQQFPRMVSSSVEDLYLDNCNLASIDVGIVEGMPSLKVLSLIGNRRLHCPSVKTQFNVARPDLRVDCEDSASDLPSSIFPDDHKATPEESLNESDTTGGEESTSETSHNESNEADSAVENKENYYTANAASGILPSFATIAVISIVIII
ncbi:slit homolog 2 protein-like [Schistocerca nitens]|uniref:slit homolog 2 protein-like n=1 Tax=Schistocerca nitens TaxID=7011 RepID=UPI0021190673|nr:slit homolog 2 protein-like [Schistocerca nitens]